MLYQKLLMGKTAYFVSINEAFDFPAHRHPELELSYCMEGNYTIIIDGKEYLLHSGDLAFVKPMAAHQIKSENNGIMMTVELGPGFLGEYFDNFLNAEFDTVLNQNSSLDATENLLRLLKELARQHQNRTEFSSLTISGLLSLISSLILQHFSKTSSQAHRSQEILEIQKVEKSIQIIYNEYATKLDIDYVCQQCGYSKSHFCRVFKKIVGETFYQVLNRHRVEIACMHLRESKDSIEEIALQVGFSDSKAFCRVFKNLMQVSPGSYRKNLTSNCG